MTQIQIPNLNPWLSLLPLHVYPLRKPRVAASLLYYRVVPLGFGKSYTICPLTAVMDEQVGATESQLPLAVGRFADSPESPSSVFLGSGCTATSVSLWADG